MQRSGPVRGNVLRPAGTWPWEGGRGGNALLFEPALPCLLPLVLSLRARKLNWGA